MMNSSPKTIWADDVRSLSLRCQAELLSPAQMDDEIQRLCDHPDSPCATLEIHIRRTDRADIACGAPGSGDSNLRVQPAVGVVGVVASADFWFRPGRVLDDGGRTASEELVASWFAGARRTNVLSGLISKQAPGVGSAAAEAVRRMVSAGAGASVLFADLDHLKRLNDELGQSGVDEQILRPLADLFDVTVPRDCTVLHRSGDEYLVICPGSPDRGLSVARDLQLAISSASFGDGLDVAISVGVAAVGRDSHWGNFDVLEMAAESALKPQGDAPRDKQRRGRTSLSLVGFGPNGAPTLTPAAMRSLAVALAKAGVASKTPFADPWLNLVSQATVAGVLGGDLAVLDTRLHDLLHWIAPAWAQDDSFAGIVRAPVSPGPQLSAAEVAVAVAHGVLRAVFLEGPVATLSDTDEVTAHFRAPDVIGVSVGSHHIGTIEDTATLELGGFVLRDASDPVEAVEPRRALIVRIGHDRWPGQQLVFADVITADDRPSIGGALPDFWEASVARVADRILRYPDIAAVTIVGDVGSARQTVERLVGASEWDADSEELSRRTGLSETALRRAAQRLEGRVHTFPSYPDALAHVVNATHGSITLARRDPLPIAGESSASFLRLQADLSPFALPAASGCRVETAAQAFPVVLQLLKDTRGDATVTDQAGVEMIDIIDFKLQVSKPHSDQIPDFYRTDAEELEGYFTSAFVERGGLFESALAPQIGRFIAHLAYAIAGPQPFSTRRALMVVPVVPEAEVAAEHELSPLGLVSVRAIPRRIGGLWRLYFSYTWRTVEAFVGLPYSLYGSLRYSEHVAELVRSALGSDAPAVSLAEVSYVAHSLHMANETYGRQVARRIIQLAS